MALVEGIGDEVLVGAGILFIVFLIIIAWLSTNIQDIPFINVIIIEMRHRNGRANTQTDSTNRIDVSAQTNVNTTSVQSENVRQETSQIRNSVDNVTLPRKQGDLSLEEPSHRSDVPVGSTSHSINISSADENSSDNLLEIAQTRSTEEKSDETITEDVTATSSLSPLETPIVETDNSNIAETLITETSRSDHLETCVTLTGNELRKRRLAFFDNKSGDNKTTFVPETVISESRTLAHMQLDINQETDLLQEEKSEEVEAKCEGESVHCEPVNNLSDIQMQSYLETAEVEGQQIRVRLKYLNDTQRQVVANLTDTIGHFRRTHFASELEENKLIRFIFNGQDLRNDTSSLQAYNIMDNSVVHCLITHAARAPPQANADNQQEFDIGSLMFPLFAVLLGVIWYLRFTYRQYFNATSTLSLVGVSFLFGMVFVGSWNREPHEHLD